MGKAFTRAVSERLAECELTHIERVPVDVERAVSQHAEYERALASAGLEIIRLPDLPNHPDAVFVEDTALLLDGHAIVTRPGAKSRVDETHSTAAFLRDSFDLHRIEQGHLDGGDVLRIDRRLYVGVSSRTDRAGIEALAEIVQPLGFDVLTAELRNCLHLKTSATFAGRDGLGTPVLLYDPNSIDPRQFACAEPLAVARDEPAGANCVRVGSCLIMPAGNPKTARMLCERGFHVVEVDVSELQKAEAGVTCMSLIDERG